MSIAQGFHKLGIETRGRTSGDYKTKCPECSHLRKKKSDPSLSINLDTGLFNCHHCEWSGTVSERPERIERNIEYTIPDINNTPLSDGLLEMIKSRGISKSTILRWRLTESSHYMVVPGANKQCINFNYIKDGELVNIKYRDDEKNFQFSKGAELILYGLDFVIGQKQVTICEGEYDALAFYEAGIHNVCSVPNGAPPVPKDGIAKPIKLDYLNVDDFKDAEIINIATDGDEPGRRLRDEIARRLGKHRCRYLNYPEGSKDANDVLLKFGRTGVKELISNASEFPLDGIVELEMFEGEIDDLYFNGYPEGCRVGYTEFDQHMSFHPGEFTVVTGIPGSGKSNFIDQLLVRLSDIHGWKHGIFSAEKLPHLHFAEVAEKYVGKPFMKKYSDRMSVDDVSAAKLFFDEYFNIINVSDENLNIDNLLLKATELVHARGINVFMMDPYNYIEHVIPKGYSETQYVSEVLTKIKRFCITNMVHTILVAHPTKIKKVDGKYEVPTLYSIAGSAHFFNKADNGIVVYRDYNTNEVVVYIQKVRQKFTGKLGSVKFQYEWKTGRYKEEDEFI